MLQLLTYIEYIYIYIRNNVCSEIKGINELKKFAFSEIDISCLYLFVYLFTDLTP